MTTEDFADIIAKIIEIGQSEIRAKESYGAVSSETAIDVMRKTCTYASVATMRAVSRDITDVMKKLNEEDGEREKNN